MRSFLLIALTLVIFGCSPVFRPQTEAERESGYTYVPIDPFPVHTIPGDSCADSNTVGDKKNNLLLSLPDNSVRMLIEKFNASGTVTYGSSKLGSNGESYRVTVDYINADTINFRVWLSKSMKNRMTGQLEPVSMASPPDSRIYVEDSEEYKVTRYALDNPLDYQKYKYAEYNIPVYIGIGLRVSANIDVIGANVNISGIGIIGAEAEAENLKGTLVVQTLGVNGKSIAAALPIQSELNRTTAQNAIVAVGSIKALLYADDTVVQPRVVGIYLPFPGGKPLVNAIISELSTERVEWKRPCSVGSRP